MPLVQDQARDAEKTPNASDHDYHSEEIDPVLERKLVKKLDWALLPLFTVVYALNFIDRTAVGNALIAGLKSDLHLVGYEYNIALTVFYIFYIIAEIPSNLLLKWIGTLWLSILVTSFGLVSLCTAFVHSFGGLIATRVFLGIAEGGTLSGLVYIISRYYRRSELVLRIGIFFGLSPCIAGAFGGLLASGLLSIPDFGVITTWRKIFLIEGLITTIFGLFTFFILPDDPENSRLLTPSERVLALERIALDRPSSKNRGIKEKTTLKLVLRAFNVNTTICTLCYTFLNISFQGLALFLPTVITTLGHFTTVESQLRTVPPYVVGAVWVLLNSYLSYRIKQHGIPIILSMLLIVIGYALFLGTTNPHARYAACFLVIAGASPSAPMLISWATDNAAPDTARAVTTAVVPGFGTMGAVIAMWTYLPSDAPEYHHGNSLNLATSTTVCVLVALGIFYIHGENSKRDRGERDDRMKSNSVEETEELGYLHPNFRYLI